MDPNPSPAPNPVRIFAAFAAYQQTAALAGALALDVFTAIGEGADTVPALARRAGAAERGIRILCDSLAALGFLTKTEQHYALTPDAALFLDRRSPAYIGSAIDFIGSDTIQRAFSDVAGAVRKGGTVLDAEGTVAPDHPVWVSFARAMAPLARFSAELLAGVVAIEENGPCRILDVAAGHGLFGISLARRNRRAEVVAVDWPSVLEVADEFAAEAGITDRFQKLPGDAFRVDFGTGYDIVLLTNFLHHFDAATCESFLRKVRAALKPGGRAVTVEISPDENRVTPPEAATFGLVMLVTTPAGDAYTFPEYERMFANAGFSRSELHPIPPSFQRVVISYT
ncbi:MAG: hypothetical protein QOD06_1298 [Candidatus Binatota bacterium]|jgi:hypothetical protein|nr:hypothetical protein [Candidatus Binatota bacterium]